MLVGPLPLKRRLGTEASGTSIGSWKGHLLQVATATASGNPQDLAKQA